MIIKNVTQKRRKIRLKRRRKDLTLEYGKNSALKMAKNLISVSTDSCALSSMKTSRR